MAEDRTDDQLGPGDRFLALLHQYDSVRAQGDRALSGQLSALGVGSAAIAALIAGDASVWTKAPLVACIGLMTVIPATGFFVLLIWATEVKKTLRATSFLRRVAEPRINELFEHTGPVLTWETEGYAYGRIVPYYVAIVVSLGVVPWLSYAAGVFRFERLSAERTGWLWSSWWPSLFGIGALLVPSLAAASMVRLEIKQDIAERGSPSRSTPSSTS